jgi:hypothetical protein
VTAGGRAGGREGGRAAGFTWVLLLVTWTLYRAPCALGQDTAIVIRPIPSEADTAQAGLPSELVRQLVAFYNDSTTLRFSGSLTVPATAQMRGRVAVFRGTLRVFGRIDGAVMVINGDLIVGAGGTVVGPVTVAGGRVEVRAGGTRQGEMAGYDPLAPVYRQPNGLLAIRDRRKPLGELAAASASFRTGRVSTTLRLETGRTYNRVEGLPIVFGPTFTVLGTSNVNARLDLRGIFRPATDRTKLRDVAGFLASTEWTGGERHPWMGFGGRGYRQILATDEQPLTKGESGWSTFLLQSDLRDYFEARGLEAYGFVEPIRRLRLGVSLRRDHERSVRASDPISILRNSKAWRPNPLIDDGHFQTVRLGLDYDTRDDPARPSTGWLIHGDLERSTSDDASPVALPVSVRAPLAPGRYQFSKLRFDLRRYARFDPTSRVNLRVTGAGWLDGDPLPVQRRVALGGPDILPGFGFRDLNCGPPGFDDLAATALCDRMLAAQLEVRTHLPVGLPFRIRNQDLATIQQILGIEQAELVLMGNVGKAWLTGDGPGRVPNNRIPKFGEWSKDIGIGIDAGGIGLYLAKGLASDRALRLTVRLVRRF